MDPRNPTIEQVNAASATLNKHFENRLHQVESHYHFLGSRTFCAAACNTILADPACPEIVRIKLITLLAKCHINTVDGEIYFKVALGLWEVMRRFTQKSDERTCRTLNSIKSNLDWLHAKLREIEMEKARLDVSGDNDNSGQQERKPLIPKVEKTGDFDQAPETDTYSSQEDHEMIHVEKACLGENEKDDDWEVVYKGRQ